MSIIWLATLLLYGYIFGWQHIHPLHWLLLGTLLYGDIYTLQNKQGETQSGQTSSIGQDYTCPHCGTVTSRYATRLQCDCHKERGEIVNLGGILHLPDDAIPNQTKEEEQP